MLLLITAIVGGGVAIRPAAAEGCSITTDDHAPAPQPCEESPEESPEDEEGESAKHAALGSTTTLDLSASHGGTLFDRPAQFAAGGRLGAAPIRGPPQA